MSHDEGNYYSADGVPLDHPPEDESVDASARVRNWPEMDESPVIPLGFVDRDVVFVMPEGNVRREPAKAIPQLLKVDIYVCGRGAEFLKNFMAEGDKGKSFQRDSAATWFNRHCRLMGPWDTGREKRQVGVWPDGPDGADMALHLGDEIWTYHEAPDPPRAPGWKKMTVFETFRNVRTGPVWVLGPPVARPEKACGRDAGLWVLQALEAWRFETIGGEGEAGLTGADIVVGWIMAGLLGGLPDFRCHLLIYAMKGSGKTTLMDFVQALMRVMVERPITDFTPAGLRSELMSKARSVILDEAESKAAGEGPSLIDQALEVLRPMATGRGGNRKMGATDGKGETQSQTAVGSALLGATKPPRLNAADASRFCEIKLLPIKAEGGFEPRSEPEVRRLIEKAWDLGPALFARALQGFRRYRADFDAIKAAMTAKGHEPRAGDVVATLAAGRRLLLYDHPLTPEEVETELVRFAPLMAEREETQHVANDGEELFDHILNFASGQHYDDRQLTIGELIRRVLGRSHDGGSWEKWAETLATFGLRVMVDGIEAGTKAPFRELDGDWLLVANGHPGLKRILKGTDYGDYRRTLSYLEQLGGQHRQEVMRPLRFGTGTPKRSLAIPLAPWFEEARPCTHPEWRETLPAGGVSPGVTGLGIDEYG